MTIPGKPGESPAPTRWSGPATTSSQTIDIAVQVSIPLVGGKVEDLIAGFVGRVFDAENKVGVKWLAGEWRT